LRTAQAQGSQPQVRAWELFEIRGVHSFIPRQPVPEVS
jgi:hypothetical protein